MRSFLVTLALGLVLAVPSAAAHPRPAFPERGALPADGAVDVPTNAQIAVLYGGTCSESPCEDAVPAIELIGPDGEALDVSIEATWFGGGVDRSALVIVRPTVELDPTTTYEVRDTFACRLEPCTPTRALSFSTGTARDDVVPAAPSDVRFDAAWTSLEGGACGLFEIRGWRTELDWEAVGEPALYVVEDADGATRHVTLELATFGWVGCSASGLPGPLWGPGPFAVRAIDVTGAASATAAGVAALELECPVVAPTEEPAPPRAGGGACAAGGSSSSLPTSIVLALLAIGRARRLRERDRVSQCRRHRSRA